MRGDKACMCVGVCTCIALCTCLPKDKPVASVPVSTAVISTTCSLRAKTHTAISHRYWNATCLNTCPPPSVTPALTATVEERERPPALRCASRATPQASRLLPLPSSCTPITYLKGGRSFSEQRSLCDNTSMGVRVCMCVL